MRLLCFLTVLLSSFCLNAQSGRKLIFFDKASKTTVRDVVVTDNKGELIAISDKEGKIIISQKLKEIYINHLNYRDTIFTELTDTLYVKSRSISLSEVVIEEECVKNRFIGTVAGLVYYYRMNFGHKDRVATFIPAGDDANKEIKKLKYWVVDDFGVKNLKYLPFKAELYYVDAFTGKPGEKIYESGIIKKIDNKKWTVIDIADEHVKMPENGIFIVFRILDISDYKQQFVTAKFGTIDAVPALRAKIFNPDNPNKSYYIRDIEGYEDEQYWQLICCHFMMEAAFE